MGSVALRRVHASQPIGNRRAGRVPDTHNAISTANALAGANAIAGADAMAGADAVANAADNAGF